MKNFVYYNNLFDIYGSLLTLKEQSSFRDYYQEDFSLSEIALENQISRSAVSKTIKTVIEKLEYYENNLHVYANNLKLQSTLELDDIEKIKNTIRDVLN